jgi:putative membrane protein
LRRRRKQYLDAHALLRSVILGGFLALLVWLVTTRQLSLYINPRFNTLIELSGYVLLPMLIVQLLSVIRYRSIGDYAAGHEHHGKSGYLPFVVFLVVAYMVPGNTLDASLVDNKGLNSRLATVVNSVKDMPRPLAAELRSTRSIKVTDRTYVEVMSEIEWFPQDYTGKEITVTGFVFRPPGVSGNQFSLVRYVIVCCAADALPYGVLCELAGADKLRQGTWLTLTGTIRMSRHGSKDVPAIKVTSHKAIEQPKKPYVFPYY